MGSRRELLKGGLALIGGSVGLGALGRAGAKGLEAGTVQIDLKGRGWSLASPTKVKGQLPAAGDRLTVSGELVAGRRQRHFGDFHATYVAVDSPSRAGAGVVSLQTHTFSLDGGTIVGSGVATFDPEAVDTFAIVGGTGRYVGASGSYTALQSYRELGGDGSARFKMTIIPKEVSRGR